MEKELKVRFEYQIYNKAEKSILTYSFVKDKYKEQLIEAIRHDLGGNPNLVIVISKKSMDEWKEKHSEKAKEEAIKEAIHWLKAKGCCGIHDVEYHRGNAANKLEEVFSDIPENVLYEIDGFSVVYDRTFKSNN